MATQDNLQSIMTGFDGTMAMIGKAASIAPGKAGEVFAASFGVMNGTITGVVSFEGSAQARADLEKAVVGVGAGYLADVAASAGIKMALTAALTGTTTTAEGVVLSSIEAGAIAAASPVLIVGAGAAAITAGLYGDDIYKFYTDSIQKPIIDYMVKNDIDLPESVYDFLGYSQKNSDTTTAISFSKNNGNALISYDSYNTTGTKTSTTVSAYSNTGELLGRSSSEHAIGDFIAVPNANSPASVIETLQQTTANSIGSATQALNVASMVGLDKNNGADSAWLKTLNSPVNTVVNVRSSGGYSNSYPNYGSFGFGGFDNFSFSWSSQGSSSSYRVQSWYPIALDLDGDGVELTSLGNSHAWFDVTGDGTKHQTGWIGADDGLLAFDENGDGKITTAKEIAFASRTSADDTDMEALASEFDTNHDGQLNASDAQFSTFRVWKDANGNGETDAGELMTLAQANNQNFKNTRRLA